MKNLQSYSNRRQIIFWMIFLLMIIFSLPVFSQDPVADFTADQTSGCPEMVVIFTDQSVNAEKWTWTFEGGSPSSASTQGPHQITYQNPGNFDVSLEVEGNNSSDKEYKTDYISVNNCSPTANFSVNPSSGCSPLTVTYTDQSVDATTWNWSFPAGNPSSAQTKGPHTVTYSSAGSYSATLVVANQYGQDTKIKNNVVTVSACYDFGDAPAPYPTTLQQNGARHTYNAALYLGQGVDREADGHPDSTATGDDTHGSDDEDGVEWLQELVPNDTARVRVTASAGGFLKAWIDFNRDGDWEDEGEEVYDGQIGEGANELEIFVPDDAVEGNTYARFRYSDEMIPSFEGEVNGGEVEDMRVYLENFHYYDYGDLPEHELFTYNYHTMLENNGARHPVSESIYLGDFSDGSVPPDVEGDGQQNPAALGDDGSGIDDEEGVRIITPLSPDEMTIIEFSFHGNGTLKGWFDWNHDGNWDMPEEQFIDYTHTEGTMNKLMTFDVPPDASLGNIFCRFRYSIDPFVSYQGRGEIGEVEDYRFQVYESKLDYGDAPESYGTTDPDAASHIMSSRIYLGEWNGFDVEPGGQPDPDALGDDNDGNDDENGVEFHTLTPGYSAGLDITSYADPVFEPYDKLHAWIDFDKDGVFESSEKVINGINLTNGTHLYVIDIPPDAVIGDTYARFRYCTYPPPDGPIGTGGEGEVEDYLVHIGGDLLDFGDAPAPFKTLLQDGGARHIIDPDVYLGSGVSADADGQPDSLASGDDDDGVIFHGVWKPGNTVKATVTASTDGYLSIWYSPAFAETDTTSQITLADEFPYKRTGIKLLKGENTVEIVLDESKFVEGVGFIRFRFGRNPMGSPGDIAPDGEVEDYWLRVYGTMTWPYEFGDAPEGIIAYPDLGVMGSFPTIKDSGPAGHISHGARGEMYLGFTVDYELNGNQGTAAPAGDPWDTDEALNERRADVITFGDIGLTDPCTYTIRGAAGSEYYWPYSAPNVRGALGNAGEAVEWGDNKLDAVYIVTAEEGAYLNVLIDWNRNGSWGGNYEWYDGTSSHSTPEHIIQNFYIPQMSELRSYERLSDLSPPEFVIPGDVTGYAWTRWTISDSAVAPGWDGSGMFGDGETEDYLIAVSYDSLFDYGDAPAGVQAYPCTPYGVCWGNFPTITTFSHVAHKHGGKKYFGNAVDYEWEGNAGLGLLSPWVYDADEDFNNEFIIEELQDAGLRLVVPYRLYDSPGFGTAEPYVPLGESTLRASLGAAGETAVWGTNLDMAIHIGASSGDTYFSMIADWDQDGHFESDEWVHKDFLMTISGVTFEGMLSEKGLPDFVIGPNSGYVWARFMLTERPTYDIPYGLFNDGETEDYLLYISEETKSSLLQSQTIPDEYSLKQNYPNPFNPETSIKYDLPVRSKIKLTIFDVLGKQIRKWEIAEQPAGSHRIIWNALDDNNKRVATGIYIYRINATPIKSDDKPFQAIRKMIFLK